MEKKVKDLSFNKSRRENRWNVNEINYFWSELFTVCDMLENYGAADMAMRKNEHNNMVDKWYVRRWMHWSMYEYTEEANNNKKTEAIRGKK